MRNLKKIAIALIALFVASTAFAVTVERGEFVVLGRTGEDEEAGYVQERIALYAAPGIDTVQADLRAGTVVQVLQVVPIDRESYYNISTVGPGGGIMGWVTEDYIYEITTHPVF